MNQDPVYKMSSDFVDSEYKSETDSEPHIRTKSGKNHAKLRDGSKEDNIKGVKLFWRCLVYVVCGVVYGIVLRMIHVFEPSTIRYQMLLKQFTFLKYSFSAMATSMIVMSLLSMVPSSHRLMVLSSNAFYNQIAGKSITSSVVGGILVGIGLTMSGACTSTVFVQIGSGVPNALVTFVGGLIGSFVYSVVKPSVHSHLRSTIQKSTNPWVDSPCFVVALPLAAMFGVTVCAIDLLIPWDKEMSVEKAIWPPYVGGVMIGLLQIPLILSLRETLCFSTFFTYLASCIFCAPGLQRASCYSAERRVELLPCALHALFFAGQTLGAYAASVGADTPIRSTEVGVVTVFCGGFLLLVGIRVCGGCTRLLSSAAYGTGFLEKLDLGATLESNPITHGITGMSLLSILSFITMAVIYISAMTTAWIMRWQKLI